MNALTKQPLADPARVRAALGRLGVSEDIALPGLAEPAPDETIRHILVAREDAAYELVLVA